MDHRQSLLAGNVSAFTARLATIAVGIAAVCVGEEPRLLYENRSPRVLDRAVVISKQDFTLEGIRRITERFVQENSTQVGLGRLIVGTEALEIGRAVSRVRTDLSYERSVAEVNSYAEADVQLASVVILNGAAILSIRNGTALTHELVSGVDSARLLRHDGIRFELLHFHVVKSPAAVDPEAPYLFTAFFKVSPRMSITACRAVSERLKQLTGISSIIINARMDHWFLEGESGYPDVFPFETRDRPPEKAAYRTRPSAICVDDRRGFSCRGVDVSP